MFIMILDIMINIQISKKKKLIIILVKLMISPKIMENITNKQINKNHGENEK